MTIKLEGGDVNYMPVKIKKRVEIQSCRTPDCRSMTGMVHNKYCKKCQKGALELQKALEELTTIHLNTEQALYMYRRLAEIWAVTKGE